MYWKVYVTRSCHAKGKAKYLEWTWEMDCCLTKILAEQVKKGNKIDRTLKPAAFTAAVTALNETFALDLSKEHIKNRLKTWKKQYGILKELLARKGFVWDERSKMVIADNSVWIDYIKARPYARQFRGQVIENYDELSIIIGNDQHIASFPESGTEIDIDFTVIKDLGDTSIMYGMQSDDKRTVNLRWTEEMDCYLSNILVEQVELRNKNKSNKFNSAAFAVAVSALNERFQLDVTKDHVVNRLRTWKKLFDILMELLDQDDFKWDEREKMVAANDFTWYKYTKINPDARHLNGRVIKNYDDLCIIMGYVEPPESCYLKDEDNWDMISDHETEGAEDAIYFQRDVANEKAKHIFWTGDGLLLNGAAY